MWVGDEGRKAYQGDIPVGKISDIPVDLKTYIDLDHLTDLIMQLEPDELVELKDRVSLLIEECIK